MLHLRPRLQHIHCIVLHRIHCATLCYIVQLETTQCHFAARAEVDCTSSSSGEPHICNASMNKTFCCFCLSRFDYHLVNVCLHSTKNPLFRFIDFFLFVCFCFLFFCLHPPTDQPDNILLGPYRCGTGPRQMFSMNSNIFLILCMTLHVKYKAICKNSNDLPCSISPHSAIPAVPCPCPSV